MSETRWARTSRAWSAGSVGEAMIGDVPVVEAETRADVTAGRLEAERASCALVTDQAGRVIGAVTLGDLLRPFGPGVVGPAVREPWSCHEQELSAFHVDELMDVAEPVTIGADAPLLAAAELMDGTGVDWLMVTEGVGHPVGILTRDDLADVLPVARGMVTVTV
jgi:CBS domain-containing protein